MDRKLINYRNPLLKKKSLAVEKEDNLIELLSDMDRIGTVFHAYGISAVQLGDLRRVFLFRESATDNFTVVINPEIISLSDTGTIAKEGCLSFPNVGISMFRSFNCKVKFENQLRDVVEMDLYGLKARVFQHEFDHLEGKTIADDLSLMKQDMICKKIKKWQKKVDNKGIIYEIY